MRPTIYAYFELNIVLKIFISSYFVLEKFNGGVWRVSATPDVELENLIGAGRGGINVASEKSFGLPQPKLAINETFLLRNKPFTLKNFPFSSFDLFFSSCFSSFFYFFPVSGGNASSILHPP